MDKPVKTVVLLSGGIDSTVALHHARKTGEVIAGISFDYGAKQTERELPFAALQCKKLEIDHQIIELPFIRNLFSSSLLQPDRTIPKGEYSDENLRQTVVPFRNGIMLAAAAGFAENAGANRIAIGAHAADDRPTYPDCRKEFINSMSDAIRLGTYTETEILRPLIAKTKAEIILLGRELGVDFSQTWSCYKGNEIHCGTCTTCTERQKAFSTAEISDPTIYQSPLSSDRSGKQK